MRKKYTVLHGRLAALALALCAAAIVMLAACANPLLGSPEKKKGDAAKKDSGELVQLSVALSSDTRIVLPAVSEIGSYRLFGSRAGGSLVKLGEWKTLTSATVSVQTGVWDFTLDAYNANGALILEGTIDDRTISAGTALSFSLRDVVSGTGSVSVTLLWPAANNLVTSVRVSLNESVTTLTPGAAPPAGLAVVYSNASVAAGDYLLSFRMLDAAGKTLAVKTEWVLVRKDLASSKEITLASTDFNGVPSTPANSGISAGAPTWNEQPFTFAWSDSSDNETGYRVEYSDDGASWTIAATLGAGVHSLDMSMPRGINRSFRVFAFNELGDSTPATNDYLAPYLIRFDTADDSIATVTVNLWDPSTLAFHGTTTLTKKGNYFGGGLQPTTLGTQLVQAYAYDASGKIKAVAEKTTLLSEPSDDAFVLTAQPVRLMGGSVQKTGQILNETPVVVSYSDMGVSSTDGNAGQMISDGLNLYLADGTNNLIKRQVISSKAVALFAGAGAGFDEDNPGQSPSFNDGWTLGLTTDGKCIYLACPLTYRIYRLNFAASTKQLIQFGEELNPFWLTSDGTYLYLTDAKTIQRLNLSNLELTHLDQSDWTWNAQFASGDYTISGGLTVSGSKLFWYNRIVNAMYAMSFEGGEPAVLASEVGRASFPTTDGNALFLLYYGANATPSYLDKVSISTGAVTSLGSYPGCCARQIATDGVHLFILAN